MSDLFITRALPNPFGKDRRRQSPPPNEKLNEEWVEFVNLRDVPLKLADVSVWHETYDGYRKTGEECLGSFAEHVVLPARWTLRLHTGRAVPYDAGTVRHFFQNRGSYVWNNDPGDTVTLRDRWGNVIDEAWYAPHPPEGVVLLRRAA